MSFRLQPTPPARLNRCQLFGPGSNTKLPPKMAASDADVINLDLEDSVSPNDKDQARKNIIEAISDIDWGNKTLSVRINSLDTPYWYRDVVDLLAAKHNNWCGTSRYRLQPRRPVQHRQSECHTELQKLY